MVTIYESVEAYGIPVQHKEEAIGDLQDNIKQTDIKNVEMENHVEAEVIYGEYSGDP